MSNITRVGVDSARNVIQVYAVDAVGKLVAIRALKRDKFLSWCADLSLGCLVAMEAVLEPTTGVGNCMKEAWMPA